MAEYNARPEVKEHRHRYNTEHREDHNEWKRKHREGLRATPEGRRKLLDRQLRSNRGIGLEEYEELLASQAGVCAICSEPPPPLTDGKQAFHVDHDHANGEIRGLLCRGCNFGLGNFRDRTDLLRAAIAYLMAPHRQAA